jgi:hypothetical protein
MNTQSEYDQAMGLDQLKANPNAPLALALAERCSPENGPELNALRMLPVLDYHRRAKPQNIAMLAELRRVYRRLNRRDELRGFKSACLVVFQAIEDNLPDGERWMSFMDDSELTPDSRTGDHLAVTRKLMGFIP